MKRSCFIDSPSDPVKVDDGIPVLPALETNAADYARFLWLIRISSFDLSHESFMSYLIWPSVSIEFSAINAASGSSNSRVFPNGLSWCLGWGQYKLPRVLLGICTFMGERDPTTAAYAMAYESRNSTVMVVLAAGNDPGRIVETVVREYLGDIPTPLKWLDF
jgi:hypothetical protein